MTYCLKETTESIFEPFPEIWHKCKWLARALSWLLRIVNVSAVSKHSTVQRITIDEEFTHRVLDKILFEETRRGHKVKSILIGRDHYYKLISNQNAITHPIHLDMQQPRYYGIDLVLHPYVDGVIPLDFSRQ